MTKRIYGLLLSLIILCCASLEAQQRNCATQQYAEYLNQQGKSVQPFKNQKIKSTHLSKNFKLNSVITIPVVVHVVYKTAEQNISDQQVKSQIDVLNEDFEASNANKVQIPDVWKILAGDLQVRFALAKRDPAGNFTAGITRTFTTVDQFNVGSDMKFDTSGGHDAWPDTSYLNIWVCNISNNILGYAQFPGNDPQTDGVVITTSAYGRTGFLQQKYDLGRTVTHEIGHWLGLFHIWGDNNCGNDQVDDTPVQKTSNTGCQVYPKISCCNGNTNCNDPDGDMFMNYMDYTDDKCMMLFTTGQRDKMNARLDSLRYELITSQGNQQTVVFSNDLEITNINTPTGQICDNDFNVSFTIKNNGINTISSATINYWVDDTVQYEWNGLLNPGESVQIISGNQSASTGLHTFHAWANSVNGTTDNLPVNNYMSRSFLLSPAEYGCPVYPEVPVINISPNPASTELTVEARFKETVIASINMYDVRGRLIFSAKQNDSTGGIIRFNIEGLPNGMYFIQALTFNESSSEKFIINH